MIVKAKNLKEGMTIVWTNGSDTIDDVQYTRDGEVKVVCNDDTSTLFFAMNENVNVEVV